MITLLLIHAVQWLGLSHGPYGTVLYAQPPGIAAGAGDLRGQLHAWLEYQIPALHMRGQWYA